MQSSGYCRTNYVARSAQYRARSAQRERIRPRAPTAETIGEATGEGFVDRECVDCGGVTLDYAAAVAPRCFTCSNAKNPYAAKNTRMSVDATGEDSANPDRIKDGTHIFNVALPSEDVEYGAKDAYGQRKCVRMRPVANNEIASSRRLKEKAKRANLTPLDVQKRAIGGR